MEEPENIIRVLDEFFASSDELSGKKVMITAGPTYEKIDPVRFHDNYSSGKMGFALAEEYCPSWSTGDIDNRSATAQNETFPYPACRCGISRRNVCGFTDLFFQMLMQVFFARR